MMNRVLSVTQGHECYVTVFNNAQFFRTFVIKGRDHRHTLSFAIHIEKYTKL